jgi:hypothetical protein
MTLPLTGRSQSEALWKKDLRGPWVVLCPDDTSYAGTDDYDLPFRRTDAILEVVTANLKCECRGTHRALPKSWADRLRTQMRMNRE